MSKYSMLICSSTRRVFCSFFLFVSFVFAYSFAFMADSYAFASSEKTLGKPLEDSPFAFPTAETSVPQDAPLNITFEFVPLRGALNDRFLTQYLMDGELNLTDEAMHELMYSEHEQEKPQTNYALIVWLEPQKGYYAYAHKPLVATRPTTVTLLENGEPVVVDTAYSAGTLMQDSFDAKKSIMAYTERTPIVMDIPPALLRGQGGQNAQNAQGRAHLAITVSGILCSDRNCWPFSETLEITDYPVVDAAPVVNDVLEESRLAQDSQQQGVQWNITPRYASPSLEVTGLGKALLFGLLAGLILNLMPCVLPVLGFKLSAFVAAMGQEGNQAERVRAFREHNIFFAFGILAWFLVLAMVLSWAGLAWGQLFQQTTVLFVLMLVVFLLALSMFGVFTLPVLDIKASTSSSPRMQAFMTGAVATLLATPCSGPLLGGVLGWAFGQSPFILAMVFVAVGLGMASPYIALSIWPNLVHKVPRAGAWTGTVEQLVGFFLMATALYLWTILPQEIMTQTMYTLFIAALCAWIWGRWSGPSASTIQRILVRIGASLVIVSMAIWTLSPKDAEDIVWHDFDALAVQEMLGHEPLVLEFTADWCPNCKVLERTTLTHDNVRAWAKEYDARFIRVDLTRNETANDAAAEALLHALGSHSIPLVALFPKGAEHTNPLVLRDIFTPSQMDEALKTAFDN